MKTMEILGSDGNSIKVHISDWEFPAIPPRPIPYVFPDHHIGTIRRGENFLGCLDVDFYCGSDNPVEPFCFSLWVKMNSDQQEDSQPRSELFGILYLDENSHMENWDAECEWHVTYIRALVYASIQTYFQLDGESPDNRVDFGEYQRWAETSKLSQPAPCWTAAD